LLIGRAAYQTGGADNAATGDPAELLSGGAEEAAALQAAAARKTIEGQRLATCSVN
jgi:hypothetical protein